MDDQQDTNLDLRDVLRTLRRRLVLIVGFLVGFALIALAISLAQTPQYTAKATLLFRNPGFDQQLFAGTVIAPDTSPEREAATNAGLVSLEVVAQRTARKLGHGLDDQAVEEKVSLGGNTGSDLVTISATDPDPAFAAALANTYARAFIAFRRTADRRKIQNAIRLVEGELSRFDPSGLQARERRLLQNQIRKLATLKALQTGNAELVQPAIEPRSTSSPKTVRNVVLGAVLGLLVGIGLALLLARFDRTVRSVEGLEEVFELPLLGTVPESQTLAAEPLGSGAELGFAESEAFRMIRAQLRYFNVDREVGSIVVTSAEPREGKSTVAWHLARAAAASGVETLLVEADLHRQTLCGADDLQPFPGLTEVLTRQSDLKRAIQRVPVEGAENGQSGRHLCVLVGGATPPNAAELIESEAMAQLLERVSGSYGLVIVDTPPVGLVADAIPLMRVGRGVIVVGRLNSLAREAAERMAMQLRRLDVDALGLVATFVEGRGVGYYDSYGAGAGATGSRPRVGAGAD